MEFTLTQNPKLGGWFDKLCRDDKLADAANNSAKSVWNQEAASKRQLTALKNGVQASEWANLLNQIAILDAEVKKLTTSLQSEKAIANSIGVVGLGVFCKDAKSKRAKAEASLRDAERALGIVKGSMATLARQQTEGIKLASKAITTNQQKIASLKSQIENVKQAIANHKAIRENEKAEIVAQQNIVSGTENTVANNDAEKSDFLGKLKENALLISAGSAVVIAGSIWLLKRKKRKKTITKKVVA